MAPPVADLSLSPPATAATTTAPAAGTTRPSAHGVTWRRAAVYLLLLAAFAAGEATFKADSAWSFLSIAFVQLVGSFLQYTPAVAAAIVADNRARGSGLQRAVLIGIAILAGTIVGMVLRYAFHDNFVAWAEASRDHGSRIRPTLRYVGFLLFTAVPAALIAVFYLATVRASDSARRTHEAALARAALERQAARTHLQLLQAQIEPHFLFNTLATLRRLYQTDAGAARVMLRDVVRYLEASLPQIRASSTTLAHEIALCRAYLNVQQVRMGGRLEVVVDVPEALSGCAFPPMLLATLVENAIKHGLSPLPEGGRITIRASAEGGRLRVCVEDTGRGWGESTGSGVGLANVRERLAMQFGGRARMTLRNTAPRGAAVCIELPGEASA
jgi:sensor histidine kinase YesM